MSVKEVCEAVKKLRVPTKYITITGGEPLEQREELIDLTSALYHQQYHVTLETNGLWTIPLLFDCVVMDYKLGKANKQTQNTLKELGKADWVKIPIQNKTDFQLALLNKNRFMMDYWKYIFPNIPRIAFSAVAPTTPKQLLSWMFEDKVTDVVLNVQIHQLIGVA